MPDNLTIKDIAKALSLSFSTVSRALAGNSRISGATTLRVREYAELHNYRPNLTAKSLRNKKNRSIGVMLCTVPNSFFAEVINGIESIASAKDYHIIVTQSHESAEKELKNLEHLIWRSVDGLLVSLSTETEDLSAFMKLHLKGKPIVFFDRVTYDINTHTVSADNADGAFKATKHLLSLGYTRIGHITSSPHLSITKERLAGYKKALAEADICVDEKLVKYCHHGGMIKGEIESALNDMLALESAPTAILGLSDRITMECFSLIRKKGLKIPDEIALVGFSNFTFPELFSPSLTTVQQPAFEMGKTATELLIKLIEAKRPVKSFERKVLPVELVIRNSTIGNR